MIRLSAPRDYFKAAKGLVSILRNPDDTRSVFDITEGFQYTTAFQRMLAHTHSQPGCTSVLTERYLAPVPDLDALLRLPPGSLGHAFASRMRAMGLDVVFYPAVTVTSEGTYMAMRLRQTHDIWHTVTGFDTTPAGELGLQAFMLAQLVSPLAMALIGGGLLHGVLGGLPKGMALREMMDSIALGWQMGVRARPLFAQRWEEGWAKPLVQWQQELDVTPVSRPAAQA